MTGFERQSSLAALALRLIIAGFFGYHFFFKLQAGFAANVTSFEMRAFPFPTLFAFVDMFVEACVIPFLLLGVYSRFCMIMLIPLMLGIWGVFWPRAFNFSLGGSELPTMSVSGHVGAHHYWRRTLCGSRAASCVRWTSSIHAPDHQGKRNLKCVPFRCRC